MLRVVPHKSAAAAHAYYTEGLQREDYYSEGQEVAGKWYGQAAERLGLKGQVDRQAFGALVENRHPESAQRLTARTKAERVVGVDFNFHAPKSLSLLHAITGDERIAEVFRKAVAETMSDIEVMAETRVRKSSAQANRFTGNLAWAEFLHLTSRPVGGIPDPHLHVHCFVFNTTFDETENRWKAVKFRNLKSSAPYMEAAFQSRLAVGIAALGYPVQRRAAVWEVEGISRAIIERFSRRTAQIKELAHKRGITDAREIDALGAHSRERKKGGITYSELRESWEGRLSQEEKTLIKNLGQRTSLNTPSQKMAASEAMDYAVEKLFERNSIVKVERLLGDACRAGLGHLEPDDLWREFGSRNMIVRNLGGEDYCTTIAVLAEEIALLNFVRTGRGRYAPLGGKQSKDGPSNLSAEQLKALRQILKTPDQVIAIQGKAGVGKTTMMKAAVGEIEARGTKVFAFAPSAAASRGTLREVGFPNANTVAHLLNNPKLQEEVRGQVIWVDEAGLLGTRDLWRLMKIAGGDTRVILTGDTGQHAPVARGDGFRLLQEYAGLKVAQLSRIRRQETRGYRDAVSAMSKGDLRSAFRRLDDLDAIKEIADDDSRYGALAADYIASAKGGAAPLVVSPTHAESAKVTEAIRSARATAGELKSGRLFTRFHDLQWQEADRKRADFYFPGLVVQFHQNAKGIGRGELFRVEGKSEKGEVMVRAESGRPIVLPLEHAKRFLVYEERKIEISKGERIRITRNGKTADGRRINSGDVFTVDHFTHRGEIVLTTGGLLNARHGHFRYGYCETSHSSQSKSVHDVIIAQSAESFAASSREQFYVSVSRGKASIKIYTDDREGLQAAVGNTARRRSAVELAGMSEQNVSAHMKGGLNGDQWRARIRKSEADAKPIDFTAKIEKDTKLQGLKVKGVSFRDYVAQRRQKLEAGLARTAKRNAPTASEQGRVAEVKQKPAELRKQDQTKAVPTPLPTRKARAAAFLKNSAARVKSVFGEGSKDEKKKSRNLPSSTVESAAKQRVNSQRRPKMGVGDGQRKVPQESRPVIRKGK